MPFVQIGKNISGFDRCTALKETVMHRYESNKTFAKIDLESIFIFNTTTLPNKSAQTVQAPSRFLDVMMPFQMYFLVISKDAHLLFIYCKE